MYSSHNNRINYIDLTIKYIDFKLIYYTINPNTTSSFIVFNDFDSASLIDSTWTKQTT